MSAKKKLPELPKSLLISNKKHKAKMALMHLVVRMWWESLAGIFGNDHISKFLVVVVKALFPGKDSVRNHLVYVCTYVPVYECTYCMTLNCKKRLDFQVGVLCTHFMKRIIQENLLKQIR